MGVYVHSFAQPCSYMLTFVVLAVGFIVCPIACHGLTVWFFVCVSVCSLLFVVCVIVEARTSDLNRVIKQSHPAGNDLLQRHAQNALNPEGTTRLLAYRP